MTTTLNEHGDEIEEGWVPDSPVLRGEVRTPDAPPAAGTVLGGLDELPHRIRRQNGLDDQNPDPGYDPEQDDLL